MSPEPCPAFFAEFRVRSVVKIAFWTPIDHLLPLSSWRKNTKQGKKSQTKMVDGRLLVAGKGMHLGDLAAKSPF
jgi:hypothetical protein